MSYKELSALTSTSTVKKAISERTTVLLLAFACGLSVGNVYFNQPLLADIGRSFQISVEQVGSIPSVTQIGYAVGLLFLAPLGDRMERRRLIVLMFILVACTLVSGAISPNFIWLCGSSLVLGFTTMVGQLIFPLVAQLPTARERVKVTSILLNGLIVGTLLSRAVSGLVGGILGWQAMYWIEAGLAAFVAVAIQKRLPAGQADSQMSYQQLIASLWHLVRQQPTLRAAALNNALLFAAFNAFWATLIFFLESPPYHYGSQVAGLFALLSVVGTITNPIVGRLADQHSSRLLVGFVIAILLSAFVVLRLLGTHLLGLALGVIVLEVGINAAFLCNRIRLFNLVPNAESRLNTVFMVTNYCGGFFGSFFGAFCWGAWQWNGVCGLGFGLLMIAAIIF
ncbi:MFS transporter [Tolypothrix campylonemoides VB511288]|nr:MFS transporter [Tolypothrix campylonemoides VB511288]